MPSHFTPQEIEQIIFLKDKEGLTHAQIAEKLGRLNASGKPNARAIMTQYTKAKAAGVTPPAQPPPPLNEDEERPDLNELSRKQRADYLKDKLPRSARGRHIFENVLSEDEQEIFIEEYFSVIREEDSLTAAEEQQLFNAILHLVLAWRAAAQDRECYMRSPISGYTGPNPVIYVDTFKKDHQENMKKYSDLIRSLKLSRAQRLEDIQRHGTTFLDFAEKYAKNDEQAKAIDEILKLESASEQELKRLKENGWLISGKLSDNKDVNYGKDKTSGSV